MAILKDVAGIKKCDNFMVIRTREGNFKTMYKAKIILLISVVLIFFGCADKSATEVMLTIRVIPPQNYSAKDSIHIVGSFNDWALNGLKTYELKAENGTLTTVIPINEENVFFTFVRNKNWQFMPANAMGKSECTYSYQSKGKSDEISVNIPLWKGDEPLLKPSHTLAGHIEHHDKFDMPQLSRKGDISVYLPKSYQQDTKKTYPVLYMLDGQNIFDAYLAHSDEWRVDEQLEELTANGTLAEIIVVSVPNGEQRWTEYNPWDFKGNDGKATQGRGELTINFIRDTLKPFIDKTYRTDPKTGSTGLAGSSLGGLMALYAAIEHSETFGFVGAFSPALAIENMESNNVLFEAIKQKNHMGNSKIYIDIGEMEYGNYEKAEELQRLLLSSGVKTENVRLVKDDLGRHCEIDWSRRLPDALKWLTSAL